MARLLDWTLIDNEFVDRVAALAGMRREEVAEREERAPGLIERLAETLAVSSPEIFAATGDSPATQPFPEPNLVKLTESVIREAARHGDTVLVGRGACACLGSDPGTLNVFVVAPRPIRVERAMARLSVGRREAEKEVDRIDSGRRRYLKTYYHRDWDDPATYDLTLNSQRLDYDQLARIVTEAARYLE